MADTEYTKGFRAGQANEQERIINLINDFSSKYATDAQTPLHKMIVETYQMNSLFIICLIKNEVENFIPNAIAHIKEGNK